MDLNEYQRQRLEKARAMRQRGVDPYPPRCRRTHSVADAWRLCTLPAGPVQVRGIVQAAEGTHDLVAGRERLLLLDVPAVFSPPAGELAFGGWLAVATNGRLALHVQAWEPVLDEAAFRPVTLAEAREQVLPEGPEVILAGRLTGGIRTMGRALFVDLEDGSIVAGGQGDFCPRIQLFLNQSTLGEEGFAALARDLDPGDIVEAAGRPFFTRMGQFSLHVSAVAMLAKAINPPPEKFHGLTDVEKRLRERYADLLANEEVRHRFRQRARVVRAVRDFLDARGYLEVETPVLQPIYGGAAARPFVTHHNQMDQDLFLRISFELYLKRLMVGMYERVYEIGHDFRNEGADRTHNPEFTMMEMYQAYADYGEMMRIFEEMVAHVARVVVGRTRIVYQGQEIELAPPWQRIPLLEAIRQASGVDVEAHPDAPALYQAIRARGGEVDPKATWAKMVDYMLSTYVEPSIVQPTFLYDYPLELSPLSKRRPGRPDTVERFEGFAVGMELCNAFSELNDPLDQEERFLAQGRAHDAGDEEANPLDEDYLNAQMYGMPPTGGLGTGIDRLAMLFTDQATIREVILFPHMRPHMRTV
jgi:lysyl-tRNA synthetase class 2